VALDRAFGGFCRFRHPPGADALGRSQQCVRERGDPFRTDLAHAGEQKLGLTLEQPQHLDLEVAFAERHVGEVYQVDGRPTGRRPAGGDRWGERNALGRQLGHAHDIDP
jgi:hypothetical protein